MKNDGQPIRDYVRWNFQCTKDPRWLNNIFLLSAEIWAEQLKNHPVYMEGSVGWAAVELAIRRKAREGKMIAYGGWVGVDGWVGSVTGSGWGLNALCSPAASDPQLPSSPPTRQWSWYDFPLIGAAHILHHPSHTIGVLDKVVYWWATHTFETFHWWKCAILSENCVTKVFRLFSYEKITANW